MADRAVVIISFTAEKVLTFEVPGKPVAFHRPGRDFRGKARYYNPRKYEDFVDKVKFMARHNYADVRPDKKSRFAVLIELDTTRNPDADNLIKPFLDGLVGVVYNDDRQVDKVWAERWAVGKDPVRQKARVTVYRMPSAATKRKPK